MPTPPAWYYSTPPMGTLLCGLTSKTTPRLSALSPSVRHNRKPAPEEAPSLQFPFGVMRTILGEANYEGANNTGSLSLNGTPTNSNAHITRHEIAYPMTSS